MVALYISGNGLDSPNGYYFDAGEEQGERYHSRQDGNWFHWWSIAQNRWHLANVLGLPGENYYYKSGDRVGSYTAVGAFTGSPVVALVPDGAHSLLGVGR